MIRMSRTAVASTVSAVVSLPVLASTASADEVEDQGSTFADLGDYGLRIIDAIVPILQDMAQQLIADFFGPFSVLSSLM